MALDIDGFDVLKRVGGRPKLFAGVTIEAKEFARRLVAKQISETGTLKDLKAICKCLGQETFVLLSDGLSDGVLLRIVSLIDPHRPDSDLSSIVLRRHFVALGSGRSRPSPKPKPPKKPKVRAQKSPRPKKSSARRGKKAVARGEPAPETTPTGFFWGTAMGATRKR